MKLCICFGICLSSEWLHLKLTFFLFSNLGVIIAQQTSIHVNCFISRGWHTSCHPISKTHTVGEGPGETPPALRCLSYLINSFLTDRKHLAKEGGTLAAPFWCLCQKLSLSLLYFNKTLLYKCSEWSSLVSGPRLNLLRRPRILASFVVQQ